MLAVVKSFGLKGLDGFPVTAEVDIHSGMPTFDIVGLADTAVKESKDRVRSALKNSGYNYPVASVVVNLAPPIKRKKVVCMICLLPLVCLPQVCKFHIKH